MRVLKLGLVESAWLRPLRGADQIEHHSSLKLWKSKLHLTGPVSNTMLLGVTQWTEPQHPEVRLCLLIARVVSLNIPRVPAALAHRGSPQQTPSNRSERPLPHALFKRVFNTRLYPQACLGLQRRACFASRAITAASVVASSMERVSRQGLLADGADLRHIVAMRT